jgi:hypothetical protein
MTYYNGCAYAGPTEAAPLDKWAHDECLPADQLSTVMLADFATGRTDPATGYRVYDMIPHTRQVEPWHWSPVWGAPQPCYVCGKPVR